MLVGTASSLAVNGSFLTDHEPSSFMPVGVRSETSLPRLVSTEEWYIGFYCHKNPRLWLHRKPLESGLVPNVPTIVTAKLLYYRRVRAPTFARSETRCECTLRGPAVSGCIPSHQVPTLFAGRGCW